MAPKLKGAKAKGTKAPTTAAAEPKEVTKKAAVKKEVASVKKAAVKKGAKAKEAAAPKEAKAEVAKKAAVKKGAKAKEAAKPAAAAGSKAKPAAAGAVTHGSSATAVGLSSVTTAIDLLRASLGEEVPLQGVTLNFSLATKPPTNYNGHVLIPLPNAVGAKPDTDVCVIVPKLHKAEYLKEEDAIEDAGIDRIIEMGELFTNFKAYEARHELANQYDLFLCDRRLSPHVGLFLGRAFYDKGKKPVLIDLGKDGSNIGALVNEAERVRNATKFVVNPGKLVGVLMGRSDMTTEELVENFTPIVTKVEEFFAEVEQEEFRNTVIKVDIKFRDSKSIPLFYHSLLGRIKDE